MENLESLLKFCEAEFAEVPAMKAMLLHARIEFDTLKRKYGDDIVHQLTKK